MIDMTDKMSVETVYGTTNEESHVMSEKVQALAGTVYKEFEKVIKRYDEDVVKDLMPLVVGILETLDAAFTEKQELDVEIELLREDNEQLLTQYEREKQLRKSTEQKYLEMEDNIEGVRKELEDKVETLESILRMSEIKSKNTADHVSRLEEKEQESKIEYTKLHERYTELFRTHMDYMERTKILMGTDKLSDLTGMAPRITKGGFSLPGLRPVSLAYGGAVELQRQDSSPVHYDAGTPLSNQSINLKNELEAQTPKRAEVDLELPMETSSTTEKATATEQPQAQTQTIPSKVSESRTSKQQSRKRPVTKDLTSDDSVSSSQMKAEDQTQLIVVQSKTPSPVILRAKTHLQPADEEFGYDHSFNFDEGVVSGLSDLVATTPELEESQDSVGTPGGLCKRKSMRNDNSIFDELPSTDIAEVDFGADITGRPVNPGDYASTDSDKDEEEEADGRENDRDSVGDNFFGMGKELDNLIKENAELMATKNALNIVKDDLIAKVDELTSEQEILREEITSLQAVRSKLQQRLTQMEEEFKRVKEENEKKVKEQTEKGEDEDDVPMAQRKRFTRVEMARVLMERNQYKERLMELQEAVRWTEMIRASREHPGELQTKKKSSVWNFFSELVAPSLSAQVSSATPDQQTPDRNQNMQPSVNSSLNHHHHAPSWAAATCPPESGASLLPSPTTTSALTTLAHITLLPPHDPVLPLSTEPVPILVPTSLNLPSTPSRNRPMNVVPLSLPLDDVPTVSPPMVSVPPEAVSSYSHTSHQPTVVKPTTSNANRITSALPGIQVEPEHSVQHI